jgi:hypothetical protein
VTSEKGQEQPLSQGQSSTLTAALSQVHFCEKERAYQDWKVKIRLGNNPGGVKFVTVFDENRQSLVELTNLVCRPALIP